MMIKDDLQKLYRDELEFLRLQGKVFSERYPQIAPFLSEKSSDPDVERLLEGFSFLSARLHQKIDDDLPELTHSLLNLLWPNYLRPLPSATMIKFTPKVGTVDEKKCINKNTMLSSVPVETGDGNAESCLFHTSRDCNIYPIEISGFQESHSREKTILSLSLKTIHNQPLYTAGCDELDIFLSGEPHTALTTYLWLFHYLDSIEVIVGGEIKSIPLRNIQPLGFSPSDALLPYPENVFDGYRIVQEFLSFQQAFYFFRLNNLSTLWAGVESEEATINFHFNYAMPSGTVIREHDFSLYCVPAVNLFKHSAEPIVVDGKRVNYSLIPAGNSDRVYDIFSVERVESAMSQSSSLKYSDDIAFKKGKRTYFPFESFQHEIEREHQHDALYYKLSIKPSVLSGESVHSISFTRSDEHDWVGKEETVSVSMLCTNADLPSMLKVGDVSVATEATPPFVDFTNITEPTKNYPPVLDSELHWSLISNLALNYLSLLKIEPLKNILRCYDFVGHHDVQSERQTKQRMDGLKSIETNPVDRLIKGFPIRGMESTLNISPEGFLCHGEVYLLGSVLAQFFSLYSSINSFHQLKVCNLGNNEVYEWPLEQGKQPVI